MVCLSKATVDEVSVVVSCKTIGRKERRGGEEKLGTLSLFGGIHEMNDQIEEGLFVCKSILLFVVG